MNSTLTEFTKQPSGFQDPSTMVGMAALVVVVAVGFALLWRLYRIMRRNTKKEG